MKKWLLAIASAAVMLSAVPAAAQYYDPYRGPPPQYRYDDSPPEWQQRRRPPPRYDDGYGYRQQRQAMGRVCVTSRGACGTRPAPYGASCQCYIEGFGRKRGNIQ